eukprot:superscaffoldBa00001041_g8650
MVVFSVIVSLLNAPSSLNVTTLARCGPPETLCQLSIEDVASDLITSTFWGYCSTESSAPFSPQLPTNASCMLRVDNISLSMMSLPGGRGRQAPLTSAGGTGEQLLRLRLNVVLTRLYMELMSALTMTRNSEQQPAVSVCRGVDAYARVGSVYVYDGVERKATVLNHLK